VYGAAVVLFVAISSGPLSVIDLTSLLMFRGKTLKLTAGTGKWRAGKR
jgi:hypothetical protein